MGPIESPIQWAPGFFPGVKRSGFATDLHIVLRLRMSGATPLLHLYAFIEWKGLLFFLNYG